MGEGQVKSAWPAWTWFRAEDLEAVAAELEPLTRKHLDALPDALLAEESEYAEETRDELWEGLKTLRKWVKSARSEEKTERLATATKGNALLLLMDADQ